MPERPGCSQSGPPGTTCSACAGAPAAISALSVGLGVEGVDCVIKLAPRPLAAETGWLGQSAADAGRSGELILRAVAAKNLSDFEQADVRKAAVGLLRRRHETRNEARPHVGEFRGDRIGERELGLAATEQFGLRL